MTPAAKKLEQMTAAAIASGVAAAALAAMRDLILEKVKYETPPQPLVKAAFDQIVLRLERASKLRTRIERFVNAQQPRKRGRR